MEQNETGCQAPQAPILCVNNCGFFGTAATMDMCSKCYKDFVLNQEQAKLAALSIQSIMNAGSSRKSEDDSTGMAAVNLSPTAASPQTTAAELPPTTEAEGIKEGPKKCGACKKRVGLTGFKCRCGGMFCSVHRYSDKHECSFDYRSAGRSDIARANPVVRADKLDKI